MKKHIPENGDIIKILPMIEPDGKICWVKQLDAVHLNGKVIYDTTNKGYLKKISRWTYHSGTVDRIPVSSRYYMNIFIDGEIHILNVGRTLFKLIGDNPELMQLKSDLHLAIVKDEKSGFPIFDNSYVIKKDWRPPVNDIDSGEEWIEWIKKNQPDLNQHINDNSLFIHKQLLIKNLGKDMLAELISDDRQKKLEGLGI
jgi:hypothetical protein